MTYSPFDVDFDRSLRDFRKKSDAKWDFSISTDFGIVHCANVYFVYPTTMIATVFAMVVGCFPKNLKEKFDELDENFNENLFLSDAHMRPNATFGVSAVWGSPKYIL